jgi:hypothetical protein
VVGNTFYTTSRFFEKLKLSLQKTSIMTLNNGKSVINLKIIRRISIIIFLTLLILIYAARTIKFPILGIDKFAWTLLILVIFLLIIFIPVIFNYQYINYSDEGEKIIFRYYSTGIIPGNKNSIEIYKKTFSGFTLEKKLFGLRQSITLYQRLQEGVAKYPAIHISALKRKEKARILQSLSSFAPIIKGENSG